MKVMEMPVCSFLNTAVFELVFCICQAEIKQGKTILRSHPFLDRVCQILVFVKNCSPL